MVNALLLLTIVVFVSVQQVTKKAYNSKVTGGTLSFSAASCMAALVVFLITSGGKLNFNTEFLISLFVYKEKLSKWQILGSALGLVSVIFLNL